MADVNRRTPTQTAYVILGLLSYGHELSGYELRRWSDRSLGAFYKTPAQSQIYTELDRLAAAGLVTSRPVNQSDNPDKVVFELTDDGRDELQRWLSSAPVSSVVVKHPVALQTSFSGAVDAETVVGRLDTYIAGATDELADLEDLLVGLDDPWGASDEESVRQRRLAVAVLRWAFSIRSGDLAGAQQVRDLLATSDGEEPT